jgi:hypothetical protein
MGFHTIPGEIQTAGVAPNHKTGPAAASAFGVILAEARMGMNDLEQAFRLTEGDSRSRFHGQKSDKLIALAEQALGLTFPPTYRTFLGRFGCGDVAGHEFYGLIDDDFVNSSVPDAIWLTLDERQTSQLADPLIVIGSTGDGGYYAIDRSQLNLDGESPVVELWPGTPNAVGDRRTVADDFGSFMLQRVREALGEAK